MPRKHEASHKRKRKVSEPKQLIHAIHELRNVIMDFTAVIASLTGAEQAVAAAITAAVAKIGSGTTVTPPDAIAQIQAISDKLTADAAALAAAAQ